MRGLFVCLYAATIIIAQTEFKGTMTTIRKRTEGLSSLSSDTASDAAYHQMRAMMTGNYETKDVLHFLQNAEKKNISLEEMQAYLAAIRGTAKVTIDASNHNKPVVDLAGTGGDQQRTVNISTLASLVVASTEKAYVYKYGNRSASGICGSMDVLEAIGVPIIQTSLQIETTNPKSHFVPVFARSVYPGAGYVSEARQTFGRPSLFNILFPLARPIHGHYNVLMGMAHQPDMEIAASVLQNDTVRALLVRGQDGTDEISVTGNGKTDFIFVHNGQIERGQIDFMRDFQIPPYNISELQIFDKEEAVASFLHAINPEIESLRLTAIRQAVLVNAAAALSVALYEEGEDIVQKIKMFYPIVNNALLQGKVDQLVKSLQKKNTIAQLGH